MFTPGRALVFGVVMSVAAGLGGCNLTGTSHAKSGHEPPPPMAPSHPPGNNPAFSPPGATRLCTPGSAPCECTMKGCYAAGKANVICPCGHMH